MELEEEGGKREKMKVEEKETNISINCKPYYILHPLI